MLGSIPSNWSVPCLLDTDVSVSAQSTNTPPPLAESQSEMLQRWEVESQKSNLPYTEWRWYPQDPKVGRDVPRAVLRSAADSHSCRPKIPSESSDVSAFWRVVDVLS